MSREDLVLRHLIEIKEDIATLKEQLSDYPELKEEVRKNSAEIQSAKASLSAVRWLAGLLFITVPAVAAALVKAFK